MKASVYELLDRADAGDFYAVCVLLLVALAVFVIEVGGFCAAIAWMESRRERHRRLDNPPPDPIAKNAERHRRLLDLEGL